LEDIIYHSLKDSRTISHTKEHYQRFKEFMVHVKDSFSLITRLDSDIVKFLANVQLSEVVGLLELGDQFEDQRE